MTRFSLRPMERTDGPALDVLMRGEPQTGSFQITTHYRHDIHRALLAQHPTLIGVVANPRRPAGWSGWRPRSSTM